MTYRVEKDKWILYRHTKSLEIISAVADHLKTFSKSYITEEEKKRLLLKLKELGLYNERNSDIPLDSINHRINTLSFFMFGYQTRVDGEKKFVYSPLGNLFLKYVDDLDKRAKIFFTMLWALQFPHPYGGTKESFHIYPFRLIFKLLREPRLDYKLFTSEVAGIVMFQKDIDDLSYDSLVRKIIDFRSLSDQEIVDNFKSDEHVLVNAVYEWDYYVSKLLEQAGVVDRNEGDLICKLQHGKSTNRQLKSTYVTLKEDLFDLCDTYLEKYPFTETPLPLDDPERLRSDVVKEIHSFYPRQLLREIGEEEDELERDLLELPKLIEEYSLNVDDEASEEFEKVLVRGFDMFINVIAEWKGGSGETDIECLYITESEKFAVDAKSTKNKLHKLSAGRLAHHREKIGGEYTIIITPRYVPSVKYDIKDQPIVLILASTFSEFLYNCIVYDEREIDYGEFHSIIKASYGSDISSLISDLTASKFGASAN